MERIIDELLAELEHLKFGDPVTHVYNPLRYARDAHEQYIHLYGKPPKKVMILGMNPGPWGMAQTGIPFGDVVFVREWLGINTPVGAPREIHPKRPVLGLDCVRSEVSGRRLWGWAQKRFKTPKNFFRNFWVANYCPLVFMEASGRNRTPDKLPKTEKLRLFKACDRALRRTVDWLQPKCVIGVGNFAAQRTKIALSGIDINLARVTHPSPANPRANQGWEQWMDQTLGGLDVSI